MNGDDLTSDSPPQLTKELVADSDQAVPAEETDRRDDSLPATQGPIEQTHAYSPAAVETPPVAGKSASTVPKLTRLTEPDEAEPSSDPRRPAQKQDIPGYEVLAELGRGGMGVVYKARHQRLKRLVGLKMILSGSHTSREQFARFHGEAEAVARLQHPNIVQIYEIGEHDGHPFFSLEYADGGSLDRKLAGNPLPPPQAAALVETLARAMHYAHQRGIVHRDLKPANVLLASRAEPSAEGSLLASYVPKITDFGLAKHLDEDDSNQTRTGAILGTPSYMAPEQASGRTKAAGPSCDVYALAAILYDLLTGRPPFKGASILETIEQVRHQEPVPPCRLQPAVPRDLDTICMKGLEKDPSRRYASALELAEDLGRFLAHEPIRARPIKIWERGVKWARRSPKDAALVATIILAVLGLLAGGWIYQSDRARTAEKALRMRLDADVLVRDAERAKESAVSMDDWQRVSTLLDRALTLVGDDPSLEDLRERAEALHTEVGQQLDERKEKRQAEEKFARFQQLRDDALFHETLFTGLDQEANVKATRDLAQTALALFPRSRQGLPVLGPSYSPSQKEAILEGCYELLLVLAESVAQPLPRSDEQAQTQAGKALSLLDQAGRFDYSTHAWHLRRSRYLSGLNRAVEAQETLTQAQKLEPHHHLDFFLLGMEAYKKGDLPQARKHLEEAQRRRPDHYWTQNFLAICHLKAGSWDKAEVSLTACLSRRPDFVWLYLLRGYTHGELKVFAAAQDDFDKACSLLQRHPDPTAQYGVHVNRGVMWVRAANSETGPDRKAQRREKFEKAVADFQQATTLKPNQFQAYANLAQAYQGLDQLDQAVAQLDRAIDLEPKLGSLHGTRARLHLERQDWAAALRDFDQAIALEPPGSKELAHVDDHVHRGRLLHRERKFQEAVEAYDAAVRLRPDYALAHRWRAETLIDLKKYAEAAQAFDRYLKLAVRPAGEVYRERGLLRTRLGNLAGAIDDYSRAIDLEPEFSAFSHRGWAYLLSDAPKLALPDFDRSLELNPENVDGYTGRGFARARLGQYRQGVADAEKALKLARPEPRTLYHAARVFTQAASQLVTDPMRASRSDIELRRQYLERALQLLRQALGQIPSSQRAGFWRDYIAGDPVLNPLRGSAIFAELATEYARTK